MNSPLLAARKFISQHWAGVNQMPPERIVEIVVCGTLMALEGAIESWINKEV